MAIELQIDQLSLKEKLQIMEALWEDLRTHAEEIPVPQWHKDVLDTRERMIAMGEARFEDWDSAKKRIADRISELPDCVLRKNFPVEGFLITLGTQNAL